MGFNSGFKGLNRTSQYMACADGSVIWKINAHNKQSNPRNGWTN